MKTPINQKVVNNVVKFKPKQELEKEREEKARQEAIRKILERANKLNW